MNNLKFLQVDHMYQNMLLQNDLMMLLKLNKENVDHTEFSHRKKIPLQQIQKPHQLICDEITYPYNHFSNFFLKPLVDLMFLVH